MKKSNKIRYRGLLFNILSVVTLLFISAVILTKYPSAMGLFCLLWYYIGRLFHIFELYILKKVETEEKIESINQIPFLLIDDKYYT
jgi:hypothetical protein